MKWPDGATYRPNVLRLLRISPSKYYRLGHSRIFRPLLWNWFLRKKLVRLDDETFLTFLGLSGSVGHDIPKFHDDARLRFFFHPRNQKDFFLNLLTKTQSEESILEEAQNVLENKFDTLGSGLQSLGDAINWHRDFKSGKVWEIKKPSRLDIADLNYPSDVKVPWELSRFHQVWWLGKAYWLTRNEQYAKKFADLANDWTEHNPVGLGVNWAVSMEAAIRATNWIAGYYFFCESRSIPDEFWVRLLKSLYVHGVFIRNHLEYSWRNGNHLISDIVGLITLGIFFRQTGFGRAWLSWGIKNLETEMEAQVHPDGVDYEHSTSYQRLVAELLYTATILCSKNNIAMSTSFMNQLGRMFEFMNSYTRPDGSIPLIGDADDGRLFRFIAGANINDHRHALCIGAILFNRQDFKHAAESFCQDALWLLGGEGFERYQLIKNEPKPASSRAFLQGGFYTMRGEKTHVIVDAGGIGMGGMGGHGHNDTLSFEYWVNGDLLIVDSGTYAYTFDVEARQEFRRGRSHNTVVIDGKEIAKFVGLWMIRSDKTKPRVFEWNTSSAKDVLEAAHYAYGSLLLPIVHRRRVILEKLLSTLEIIDRLEARGSHGIESFLHLAPSVSVELVDPRKAQLRAANGQYVVTTDTGEFKLVETWYSRSYGIRERNWTIVLSVRTDFPCEIVLRVLEKGDGESKSVKRHG